MIQAANSEQKWAVSTSSDFPGPPRAQGNLSRANIRQTRRQERGVRTGGYGPREGHVMDSYTVTRAYSGGKAGARRRQTRRLKGGKSLDARDVTKPIPSPGKSLAKPSIPGRWLPMAEVFSWGSTPHPGLGGTVTVKQGAWGHFRVAEISDAPISTPAGHQRLRVCVESISPCVDSRNAPNYRLCSPVLGVNYPV